MREIKFRAWDGECMLGPCNLWDRDDHPIDWLNDLPYPDSILMQFTGLKDKNDKEIYEGDILLIEDSWKEPILEDGSGPTEPANHLAAVTFSDGAFGADIKEGGDLFDKAFWSFERMWNEAEEYFEVIGNIYENPELIRR